MTFELLLFGLQAFQVLFLWLHDWLPVPPRIDVSAVRREDPLWRLIVVTPLQSFKLAFGLALDDLHHPIPG